MFNALYALAEGSHRNAAHIRVLGVCFSDEGEEAQAKFKAFHEVASTPHDADARAT